MTADVTSAVQLLASAVTVAPLRSSSLRSFSAAWSNLAVLAAALEVQTKNFSNLPHGQSPHGRDHPQLVLQPLGSTVIG